jgi:1-acyl-sn-glycerol-3-phosphate acyltransferase
VSAIRKDHETTKWDPGFTERLINAVGPIARRWFRCEVRGLESLPAQRGALVVANHSGGMLTPDVLIFASAFYGRFGYDRPLYTLGHDGLFPPPVADWLARLGVIHASSENAVNALRSGGVVLVFPGGIYDAYRPTLAETSWTSTGAPDMSGRRWTPARRSCRRCPSAARRVSCS